MMKKICLLIALLMLVNISIFSQQEPDRKFTFQTSPGLFFADLVFLGMMDLITDFSFFIMDLEFQYKINDTMNVSFATAFYNFNDKSPYFRDNEFQMIFKPMFIYRPLKTGLKGFYLGLNLPIGWNSYRSWYVDENGEGRKKKDLGAIIGLGLNIGYKWIFKNGFTLQLGTGIGKTWILPSEGNSYLDGILSPDGGIRLPNLDIQILDFKLGYSF